MKYLENVDLETVSGILTYKELGNVIIKGRLEAFLCDHHSSSSSNSSGGASDAVSSTNPLIACGGGKKFSTAALLSSSAATAKLFVSSGHDLGLSSSSSSSSSNSGKSTTHQIRKRSVSLNEWEKPTDNSRRRRSVSMSDAAIPSKRLHFDLIAALGEIFPDYDYRFTSSHQFVQCTVAETIREVNSYLAELATEGSGNTMETLWTAVDNVVNLASPTCEIYKYLRDKDDNGPLNSRSSLWSFHYFFFNKDGHKMCYFGCKAKSKLQKYLHHRQGDRQRLGSGQHGEGDGDDDDGAVGCASNGGSIQGSDCSSADEDDEDADRLLTFVPSVSSHYLDEVQLAVATTSEAQQLRSSGASSITSAGKNVAAAEAAPATIDVGGTSRCANATANGSTHARGSGAKRRRGNRSGGSGASTEVAAASPIVSGKLSSSTDVDGTLNPNGVTPTLRRIRSNNSVGNASGRKRDAAAALGVAGVLSPPGLDSDASDREDDDGYDSGADEDEEDEDEEDEDDGGYLQGDDEAGSDSEDDELNQSIG